MFSLILLQISFKKYSSTESVEYYMQHRSMRSDVHTYDTSSIILKKNR